MTKASIHFQSCTLAGCCAVAFVIILAGVQAVASLLGARQCIPDDGPLLAVFVLFLWVAVLLVARAVVLRNTRAELLEIVEERGVIPREEAFALIRKRDFPELVSSYLGLPAGVEETAEGGNDSSRSQSELRMAFDQVDSRTQAWYWPVHGLIWALPGVGFLGTAWKLRQAIKLAFASGSDLTAQSMAGELEPILGSAFDVICAALAASVLMYVASTLMMKVEAEFALFIRSAFRPALETLQEDREGQA